MTWNFKVTDRRKRVDLELDLEIIENVMEEKSKTGLFDGTVEFKTLEFVSANTIKVIKKA